MSFSFRNMQTFIRNCIEPHVVALNGLSNRRFAELLSRLFKMDKEHRELLTLTDQELRDYVAKEVAKLQKDVTVAVNSITSIEVGWIGFWPVSTKPKDASKWLQCDGSRFDQSTYQDLFNVLKSVSLPDYRGYFLRCEGGNAAALGVHQGDAIQNIYGEFDPGLGQVWCNGVFSSYYTGGIESSYNRMGSRYVFNASRVVPTANENRPVNKAVQFWIRVLR